MSETFDLRQYLTSWPYDPDDDSRFARLTDGRTVLQVRLPLGIEQYEVDGRPDGLRPHGQDSLLELYEDRFAKAQAAGHAESFQLSGEDCVELFNEGTLYYLRYLHLFELHDWKRTARDTARNLRLFDFVRKHASREDDREHLEKWRPYIVRMNAIAQAMTHLEGEDFNAALGVLERAVEIIEALDDVDDETFRFERTRSVGALRELIAQVSRNRPLSEVERLERDMRKAIAAEAFERAAQLRDRIRALRDGPKE